MKKILTILLFAFALTADAQNIWRAPSVFEQWVNFSNTVTQKSGADSVYLQFVNGRWLARKDSCFLSIGALDANIGKINAYSIGAGGNYIDLKKTGADTINIYFRNDTAFVDGKSKIVAWQFNPPLPTTPAYTCDSVQQCLNNNNIAWLTTGNSNTNPATDFVGTTDDNNVVFKRNNRAYGYFGSTNLALGDSAGFYHGAGNYNIFLGYEAGKFDAPSGASNNICIGYQAGFVNSGSQNVFLGQYSGVRNITPGNLNTFLGYGTGTNNTTGAENTFVGASSGSANIDGSDNVGIGYNSLQGLLHGNNNTCIGRSSGTAVDSLNNSTAIGANSYVGCENCVSIGDTANANVGIGTAYPTAKLDVRGAVRIVDGTQGLGKVLTSDANGLASWQYSDSLIIDSVATTGDTTQLVGNAFVAIIATGAITDLVLQFPAAPYNNMAVIAKFDFAVTTLTADGNGATVYGFPSSTALGQHREWKYNAATNSWY